jgi:RNase P subunit RPR2
VSAEPAALIPQCEECRRVWLPHERQRWRAYFDDEDQLVLFCPECARREFDDDED